MKPWSHYRVKKKMHHPLRIGELAVASGCPADTIRFYEREGLLPAPVRTSGNYRVYSEAHADRLAFIRNCRGLDMTLDEIRELLGIRDIAEESCAAAHRLVDAHMAHVADRIAELQQLEKQLRSLRRSCSSGKKRAHCAILDDLTNVKFKSASRERHHHVRGSHRA